MLYNNLRITNVFAQNFVELFLGLLRGQPGHMDASPNGTCMSPSPSMRTGLLASSLNQARKYPAGHRVPAGKWSELGCRTSPSVHSAPLATELAQQHRD